MTDDAVTARPPTPMADSDRPRPHGAWSRGLGLAVAGILAACAASGSDPQPWRRDPGWPHADLLLLGEQHDARVHQQRAADVVAALGAQQRLAAVVMEMADQGRSTAALTPQADEATAREALAWNDRGWPWAAYGPIVMAAVRAGVPVVGGNVPRPALRAAGGQVSLDDLVAPAVREQLRVDVRDGHCGLLPESQLPAMVRMQIARDESMAKALLAAHRQGRVTVLVAGSGHVDASRGVPRHLQRLAPTLRVRTVDQVAGASARDPAPGFDERWASPPVERGDPCEALRTPASPTSPASATGPSAG